MSLSTTSLGKRLRAARINCILTQEDAAEKINVTRTALVQIEAGNRSVSPFELVKLAKLYQVDVSLLLSEGTDEDEPLVALFRIDPRLSEDSGVQQRIAHLIDIFQEAIILEQQIEERIEERIHLLPPAYDFPDPKSYTEAVKQGQELASQERKRLDLRVSPISNVADLITAQGIWVAAAQLSDELSGLFLHHPTIGMAILVNSSHMRGRRRFSYAHEYAHSLVDRKRSVTITSRHNANELIEKRANAFASEFLMPTGGVKEALARLNKGGMSRQSYWLYDVANDDASYVEKRILASSQKILSQDVALISHEFQVSYQAAAYKLSDMRHISRQELSNLLKNKEDGRDFLAVLKLRDPERYVSDEDDEQPKFMGQVARLAIEAYRRKAIDKKKLLSISRKLDISGETLLKFAVHVT